MLRWLFPINCELCGEPAEHTLCAECLAELARVPRPICLYCGAPLDGTPESTECCKSCRGLPRVYDFARSALYGDEKNLDMLYRLKYGHAAYLARGLALALRELWESTPELADYDRTVLVPVPMTRRHLCRRGYNQAAELARFLARMRGLPMVEALRRTETTADSQTRLGAGRRYSNALHAFCAHPMYENGRRKLPEQVVLVDDVYTTGATSRACARALRSLPGVRSVAVITLVRARSQGAAGA